MVKFLWLRHTDVMNQRPAVILLADDQSARMFRAQGVAGTASSETAMEAYSPMATLIRRLQGADLPMMLVAPPALTSAAAPLLSPDQLLTVAAPSIVMQRSDWLVRGMAAGILACSQAGGWIVLPVDMPMVQADTLVRMGEALRQNSVVYPCHAHKRGHPVGFSTELFSELVQLFQEQDLRRLVARYPAADVDVNDPGIHMAVGASAGLEQWRAQLGTYSTPRTVNTGFGSFRPN